MALATCFIICPIGLAGKEYPEFKISDAFFEPLPDDMVAAFHGEDS